MIKQEWNYLLKNKILLLVFLAIIAIPTIYTTLFLGSMWDPYGKVDNLPVAVVNQDRAVQYNGKNLNIGKQMVNSLKKNDSLDFDFTNAGKAQKGLADGRYYMVITIPEDFSANASSVLDTTPKEMELKYETNPGTNYIASKLSETALSKIRTSIANSVTKVYAEAVFDQVGTLGAGMTAAADGSSELTDGAGQLASGNQTIAENLLTLANSSLTFKNGSETLSMGLKEYTDGVSQLNTGANDLKNGLQTLHTSTNTLSGGAADLADGAGQLDNGVTSYTAGIKSAEEGAKALVSNNTALTGGVKQLQQGVAALSQNSASLNSGVTDVSNNINQAISILNGSTATAISVDTSAAAADTSSALSNIDNAIADNEAAKNSVLDSSMDENEKAALVSVLTQTENELHTAKAAANAAAADVQSLNSVTPAVDSSSSTQQALAILNGVKSGLEGDGTASSPGLIKGIQSYTTGVSQIQSAVGTTDAPGTLVQGIQNYMTGTQTLYTGMEKLNQNSSALSLGASSLNSGLCTLESQTPALTSGVEQLYLGSLKLGCGTDQLVANNATLLNGNRQLTEGAGKISGGAGQLARGSITLGDGINKVSQGAGTLSESLSEGARTVNSIKANDNSIKMFADPVEETEAQLTTVENNGHAMAPYMMSVALWVAGIAFSIIYPLTKYHGELKSGFSWWASKASILIIVAFLDAIVMVGALYFFNGFHPQEMAKTILVACLASISFMAIMYFFNVALGKVGSFLMLIYMVIQLSGAAGTYPVELSGSFVSKIHYLLPFTYTVDAFRSTISGGNSILPCIIMLLLLLIIFSSLTVLLFKRRAQKIQKGKPLLMDFLETKGLA